VRCQRAFQLQPDEISLLHSAAEGGQILARNGFETVFVDSGARTLMAFKILMGRRPVMAF
jgi:hypothetical protein